MTVFFIRPLLKLDTGIKGGWRNSRLNEVALRTLVASVVCLIASFANVIALVLLKGRERGLVCLTCCTVDVTINVITIHWVKDKHDIHSSEINFFHNRLHLKHLVNEPKKREWTCRHTNKETRIQTMQTMSKAQMRIMASMRSIIMATVHKRSTLIWLVHWVSMASQIANTK